MFNDGRQCWSSTKHGLSKNSVFGALPNPGFSKNSFTLFKSYHKFYNLSPITDVDNDRFILKRAITDVDNDCFILKRAITDVDNDCFILKRAITDVGNDCFILKRAITDVGNHCYLIKIQTIFYSFYRKNFNNDIISKYKINFFY